MSVKLLTVFFAGFILVACRSSPAPTVTSQNAAQTEKPPVFQAGLSYVDQVIFSIPNTEPWMGNG